jgi:integrase
MKVPTPKKLPSGSYHIRLRLGDETIYITKPTAKECTREAEYIKAEHRAEKRTVVKKTDLTPSQCIDQYLATRMNTLSPSTVRFYRTVQKHRFPQIMNKPVSSVEDWQAVVDAEAARYCAKTLSTGYGAIKTAIGAVAKLKLPDVSFGVLVPNERAFLLPEEIPLFVAEAATTKYAVPLLLALSSLRISEIQALDWKDIPEKPDFVRVRGAVVFDENNKYIKKAENKNSTSNRNVPVLIPELKSAIKRDRKPSGQVMPCTQNNLRVACRKICQRAGVTEVSPHGLRHSFASLAYHLHVPEYITMEIAGWSDEATMRKIYRHIAQSDIERYKEALGEFYESGGKNGDENGDGTLKPAKQA